MKTVLLISSCDAFMDCWDPMLYSIDRFWPDCPFPIYLVNNHLKINKPNINVINVGKDEHFASNLKLALQKVACEYVIYFQEDYFLTQSVNTDAIKKHVKHCIEKNIDFLKIHSNDFLERDRLRIGEGIYCNNPIDVKYSLNTSIAIWKKSTLEKICIEGYSGWEWERNIISFIHQEKIIIKSEILHSSSKKLEGITTISGGAVAKGRWTRKGRAFLLQHGFSHLLKTRSIEGVIITKLAQYYNQYPRSISRYVPAMILKVLLKLKINI